MAIKIATYNIANGRYVQYDYRTLAQDILSSGADIIGLQEVDQNTSRNRQQDTLKLLSEYTGFRYYSYAPALIPYQGGAYGNGILSRYPILSAYYDRLPRLDEAEESRTVLCADIEVGQTRLCVLVTHCEQSSILAQLDNIQKHTSDSEDYIVLGDFNYENFSAFSVFPGTTLANHAENRLDSTINGQAFDNMVFSPRIQANHIHLIQTGHSDHHMLVAEVTGIA